MRYFFLMAIVPSAVCSRYVTLHAFFFHRRGGHTVLRGYYTFKLGHCLINQPFRHLLSGQFDFNEWSVTQCFYIHGFYLISDLKVFASGIFVHCLVARAASGEYDILG